MRLAPSIHYGNAEAHFYYLSEEIIAMGLPKKDTVKLSRPLLEKLGISIEGHAINRKKLNRAATRKEQRKLAREQKRSSHIPRDRIPSTSIQGLDEFQKNGRPKSTDGIRQSKLETTSSQPKAPKVVQTHANSPPLRKEVQKKASLSSSPPQPSLGVPRNVQKDLSADDAEIAALEKALGMKGKKRLPNAFENDGLMSLLDGIDNTADVSREVLDYRGKIEEKQWLENKRRKTQGEVSRMNDSNRSDDSGYDEDSTSQTQSSSENGETGCEADLNESYGSYSSDEDRNQQLSDTAKKKTRENPYVAPPTDDNLKRVQPSQHNPSLTETHDLSRLRRQIQGFLNRLAEANLLSILANIESFYRDYPRQYVSTTLLDLLMSAVCDPTILSDTFMILHAGFIAAVYKVIGADFGVQTIQRIDEQFEKWSIVRPNIKDLGKILINLTNLLAELYNFQVVGSNLIYEFIRSLLEDISESNSELLLKIIRNTGPQLRQDDPSSLKEITHQLQASVIEVGEQSLSLRMKYMIEAINDLKNNRRRNTGNVAMTIASEHRIRMKKTLGSLNTRSIKASEPLRVTMKDIRNKDKVGMWWLVGASYKGGLEDNDNINKSGKSSSARMQRSRAEDTDRSPSDLVQLAKDQRMNTDVRRSIFIAIMSSSDYSDAYVRLKKLRLKRLQELEIPKVVLQCSGTEEVYNPFYTSLSRRLCSDKRLKMSFQFSLWDLFKQMGEGNEDSDGDNGANEQGKLELRTLVNIAKLYGVLVAEDGLGLGILKNLNLAFLQPRSQMFLEVLMITAVLHSQEVSIKGRNEKSLLAMFLKPKEIPHMASGLRYFLKKVVRKTDIAGSKSDKETVIWACGIICDALAAFH